MYPVLFEIFGLKVNAYGFLVAMGFMAGLLVLHRLGPAHGIEKECLSNLFIVTLLSSIIGARLLYVMIHWPIYQENPLEILMIWRGGQVIYGGFLSAVLALYLFARFNGIRWLNLADVLTPCAFIGTFIGRWGCLLVGDCYGARAPETLPWAVRFPYQEGSLIPSWLINVPLHPTQIYMSLAGLLLFIVTVWILRRRRFDGQVFFSGIMLYSVLRSLIEFYRGDVEERGFWGPFSTSQWISLFLICLAALLYRIYGKRAGCAPEKNAECGDPKDP